METGPSNRRPWSTIGLVGLIVLLGATLRLLGLGGHSLWLDEIFTATFVRVDHSLKTMIGYALSTPIPAPPLWFIITRGFVIAMGSSEFVLRLPAAAAGILAIAVVYRVGRALFGHIEGLIAAFLISISPFHIYYSREARYYAALALFSLLTLYFLHLAVNRREWQWWAGFVVMTIVNVYIHLMAFLVLLAEMAFVGVIWAWHNVVLHDVDVPVATGNVDQPNNPASEGHKGGRSQTGDRISLIPVFLCLSVIVLSYAPMWSYVLRGLLGPRGLGNLDPMGKLELSMPFFISTFGFFGAGPGLAFALFMGAFLWGLAVSIPVRGQRILLTLLWMAIPLVFIFVARPKHFFSTKYLIFILPVYLMGAAAGIAEMGRSVGDVISGRLFGKANQLEKAAVALGTLGVVTVFAVVNGSVLDDVYAIAYDDWGNVGRFLRDNAMPDDIVICLPVLFVTLPVEEVLSYYGPNPDQIAIKTAIWPSYLDKDYATHRRVWLVSTHYTWVNRPFDITHWLQDKEYVELRFERGFRVLFMGAGMSRDALLTEAIGFSIPDAPVWGSLAEALQAAGRVEEAIAAYHQASRASPRDGIWHALLGRLYYDQTQNDLAIAEYREAIRLAPDIPGFHSDLAEVLRSSGDRSAALAEYRRALQLYLKQRRGTENNPYIRTLRLAIVELEAGQ
jgi:mannosyltransferase